MNRKIITIAILILIIMTGCVQLQKKEKDNASDNDTLNNENIDNNEENNVKEEKSLEEIIAEFSPNEIGDIPVIMYHAIIDPPPSEYQRSTADFWKDLKYFYDNNYRTISLTDFINHNITIPAGMTPVLLTFDDGEAATFSLVEENGVLKPAPNTGIEILERFCAEYPDFGKNAALFINGHGSTFKGAGTLDDRLKWLVDNGYEIGNHTDTHAYLNKATATSIQKELGIVDAVIKKAIPGYIPLGIALPFGISPSSDILRYLETGTYEGNTYSYKIAFKAGPSKVRQIPTIHVDFDPWNAPRLRGNEGEANGADLWGYLSKYERYPEQRYISDGNPDRIVVPIANEKSVDTNKLNGKELVTY